MDAHPHSQARYARPVAAVGVAAIVAALAGPVAAHAASHRWGHGPCPSAETLVAGTTWHTHKLAPGITLSEGDRTDENGRGLVKMHVLRIVVGQAGVSFRPLMHAVAQRTPLSKLASGRANIVAAVNTGYFDFATGAPTQPLIVNGNPLAISSHQQQVLGFDSTGALQVGRVHLAAAVFDGKQTHAITGLNQPYGNGGLQAYSPAWGGRTIPAGWQAVARQVVANKLGSDVGRNAHVPPGGYALTAQGSSATRWLSSLSSGSTAGIAGKVKTTTTRPFKQAYGVGVEVVKHYGQTRNDLSCNSANTRTPARTAFGVAGNGKVLVIGEVEDHPGTNVHGLDANQMSGFMAQLGVDRAFDVDGSGSTELLAQMPGTSTLTLRTYPADGEERAMPVGLGIFFKAPKVTKHHKKTH